MATGIMEGTDLPVTTAHDDDGIGADLNGEIAAGLRHLTIMADKQPVAIPDRFHVQLEIIRVRVERLFQAEAFAAVLQLAQYGFTQFHGQILDQTALPGTIHAGCGSMSHLNTGGYLRQRKQRHRLPHWRQIATCADGRRRPFRLRNPRAIRSDKPRRNMTHDAAHILSTRQKTGVTAQRSFNAA